MRRGRLATRLVAAALLASLAMFGWPHRAHAAEYTVSACGRAANFHNNLLLPSVSGDRMSAYTACPTDGTGHVVGAAALAGIDRGTVPVFANAMQTFLAPAGTTIARAHVNAEGRTWNGDWSSLLQVSNDRFERDFRNLAGCSGNPGSANGCVSASPHLEQNYETPGATGLRTVVSCGNFAGCSTFSTDFWPFTRSYYFVREFDVTLKDESLPTVTSPGGALASQRWLHGTHSLTFDAHDNTGIRRMRFWAEGLGHIADDIRDCDYTFAVPCSNVPTGEYWLDTARLPDGVHHVAAEAFDATGFNLNRLEQTIFVDNHAPGEPGSPRVLGGEGWHTTNDFTIRWDNPPSAAPIDRATYEVCSADGSGCFRDSQAGNDVKQLAGIRVPRPGDYTIRVWLSDQAGNVSDARTAPLHLKFDNVPPAQAAPQHRNGWVNAAEAHRYDQEVRPPLVGAPPVSGISSYAVTTNGAAPGVTGNVRASDAPAYIGHLELSELANGTTVVRARAISGAGVASNLIGSTVIHVDKEPPAVNVQGKPDPEVWNRAPVALQVTGTDGGNLSGMATPPGDRGAEAGGHLAFTIDAGERQTVPGPIQELADGGLVGYAPLASATVSVSDDGVHTVSYQAADVAGNVTDERSVHFKIDQTAPELAVFEAQQEADPRLVTVAASDRTSGLADGAKIELRRISPTHGSWITLHTSRQDDRYYAHIDNTTLPEGDYEFKATIPDQAGNEATATHNRLDQEEILHITPTQIGPYRTSDPAVDLPHSSGPDAQDAKATIDTRLTAGAVERVVKKRSCKRKGKRPKKCPRGTTTESLVHELRVAFGKRATVHGKLTTSAGAPIARAEVTVLARPSAAGVGYRAVGSFRTDVAGAFTYRAPAGSSRSLDFLYRGDDTYKAADDQVTLRVPAKATIRVNKHHVRNGRTVLFTGKLLGQPYPAKGKVLDLQAYYRGRWRTFASPRTGQSGKWKYRYRFQATRGVVIYKFRLRVRATSDYPYEPAYSKAIKVRVVG